jgi:hypothetical protein
MTKTHKILLSILGVGVASAAGGVVLNQPPDLTGIEQTKIVEKFQASPLLTKYVVEGSSFKRLEKADPKDRIQVRIGDETGTDFNPSFELKRWDEVSLRIVPKLQTVATKDKDLTFDDTGIKFKNGTKEEVSFEDIPVSTTTPEGGYEINWTLNEKPATNKIEFTLETQGLDFFYQPPLDEEMKGQPDWTADCTPTDCGGSHRPENVVGSYAVYAKTPKTNWTGGKEYKTGKVGHIYRPSVTDATGKTIWADLFIDAKNGIMTYTIDQKFLDEAIYPVSIK